MTNTDKKKAHLRQAGEALYGQHWQAPLAADLGISARSVRYWLTGERNIPQGVWHELATLLKQRGQHALALAAEIESQLGATDA